MTTIPKNKYNQMKHLNESVVSRRSGKYNGGLPDKYDDFTFSTIPDLMDELEYRYVYPSNPSSYIGGRMARLSKEGVGCWSSGDSSGFRGKGVKWFRFCAPYSEYVFFIRIPGGSMITDFWVDWFKNKLGGYEQMDNLSFVEWLSMAKEELGLK